MPYAIDALAGKTVLVADGEAFLAEALDASIRSAGGDVLGPLPSVEQAMERLAGAEPDAAVLDIRLIDEDVCPIVGELMRRHIPLVFASPTSTISLPPRFAHIDVMNKPYTPNEVVRALAALLNSGPRAGTVSTSDHARAIAT